MAKKNAKQYRFLQTVTYAPLGDKEYPQGSADALFDWDAGAVQRALKAGLIETVQGEVAALPVESDTAGKEDNE